MQANFHQVRFKVLQVIIYMLSLTNASSESVKDDNEGLFLSLEHWYPPNTTCTFVIQGSPNEIVRLYFPSFKVTLSKRLPGHVYANEMLHFPLSYYSTSV